VSKYREKLDRIQSKLLSGDVNTRGLNSVNEQEYDRYDKINGMIEKPLAITSDLDHEYYWVNYTVPMINKKYCEMRSNFNTQHRREEEVYW
jgi:hypothetical protein